MLALAFLNPWVLWLLPLAAIPIVIHLLNRRRYRTVRWAAMSFLLAAAKRNRRRMRMEQWLILALRTLAVLLLVFLVARPEFDGAWVGRARTHHIVCLDDSASMAQRSVTGSAFDEARERIHAMTSEIAKSNEGGDLFTLFLASRPDAPIVPVSASTSELPNRVRTGLARTDVGDARVTLERVLESFDGLRESGEDAPRAVFTFVTDMRTEDWVDAAGEPLAPVESWLANRDPETDRVRFVVVGSDDAENVAITSIRCHDRVATIGLPLTFSVEIVNRGRSTTAATDLFVEFGERTRTSFRVPPLGTGERTSLEFEHAFHTPGRHGIRAQIASDRYEPDDTRSLSVDVREQSRVLVVDGDAGDSALDAETHYLHAALEIRGAISSGVAVRLLGEHEVGSLSEADLGEFDMVWLCNVGRPAKAFVELLERFVANGGGLAVFLGNQVDVGHYNEVFFGGSDRLLPGRLVDVAGDIDDKRSVHLAAKDHPMFATNTEQIELMFEKLVSVGRYVETDESVGQQGSVLLRVDDDDGPPLLLTGGLGRGTTFLFTSTADTHWTSMPVWPVYVMTVVSMHRAAARPQDFGSRNLTPEGAFTTRLDPGRVRLDAVVQATGEEAGEARTFTASQPTADAATVPLTIPMRELRGYGLFEVTMSRHDGTTERELVSRNSDVDEGRLERLTGASFERLYSDDARRTVSIEAGANGERAAVATAGSGAAWRTLALAMLVGMLLETLLAWRFGRNR